MYDNKPCIIRCDRAGVFFARVAQFDSATCVAELSDARRLWYWDGAASLSQMAMEGVKAPENCRFTVSVPVMTVTGVIEIIPCTDKAAEIINGVAEWKR